MTPGQALALAAEHFAAGRLEEAERLGEAVLRSPGGHQFYALHLLSAIAAKRGEAEQCVRLATRALAVEPAHPEVLCNRGVALRMLHRYDEALADFDRVLTRDPRNPAALTLKGVALAAMNRHAEAIACYADALAARPDYAPARFNRSLSFLVTGDFANGWPDYEWRWSGGDTPLAYPAFAQPQWRGEDVRGKTVLLYAEQGFGDAIQFARYAPLVAERGAKVLLRVHAALAPLFAGLPGIAQVLSTEAPLPAFDLHCPLMSLPLAFGTRVDTIPAEVPYLRAPEEHVTRWKARLGEAARPRVGLTWSGSAALRNDRNRSIPLARLAPLRREGVDFVALQNDVRETDRAALADSGIATFSFGDFRDTAALVALVDRVITVDTAAAHLAGALGKPVWLLLPFAPDWRWLLEREDSPWYPGMRLFRQPRPGDWDPVIRRVADEMTGL